MQIHATTRVSLELFAGSSVAVHKQEIAAPLLLMLASAAHSVLDFLSSILDFLFILHSGCNFDVAVIIYLSCITGSSAWSFVVTHPPNVFQ